MPAIKEDRHEEMDCSVGLRGAGAVAATGSGNNLRRTMRAIVKRAGMKPWSDVFQTLRRSCATEWKESYPAFAVDAWLGHSGRVSEKHYLMIPDELWDRVGGAGVDDAAGGAAIGATEGPRTALQPVEVPKDDIEENPGKRAIPCDSGHWAEAELNRRHTDFQSAHAAFDTLP